MASAYKLNNQRDLIFEFLNELGVKNPDDENIVIFKSGSGANSKYKIYYFDEDYSQEPVENVSGVEIPAKFIDKSIIDECMSAFGWNLYGDDAGAEKIDKDFQEQSAQNEKEDEDADADLNEMIDDGAFNENDLDENDFRSSHRKDVELRTSALNFSIQLFDKLKGEKSLTELFKLSDRIYKYLNGEKR